MKKLIFTIFLFFSLNCLASQGGFIRSGVIPNTPVAGQNVTIGIESSIVPCLGFYEETDLFYHLSNDNHITFVVAAIGVNPCPNIPGFSYQHNIGQLPAGNYTAQVYTVNFPEDLPQSINDPLGFALDDGFSFVVQGTPTSVPAISLISGLILLCVILIFTRRHIKKTILFTSVFLLTPFQVSAKDFILLISNEIGAPSVEDVVNNGSTSPPPDVYILDTFNDFRPDSVSYLLSERPYGQRLDLINQYPDWLLAKMYRYIVVNYPDNADSNDLLNSYDNDQFVLSATDLSTLTGVTSNSNEVTPSSESSNGNFIGEFISDLDITMAWQLSEGMGYIGIIDSGVATEHPAFKAFDENGQYLGGNLLDSYYQLDFGSGDFNIDEKEPFNTQGNALFEACDLADGEDDNLALSRTAGHGTHVAGVISAKDSNVSGICKNCGLGVSKWTKYATCLENANPPTMSITNDITKVSDIFATFASSGGYGTINWSGGIFRTNNGQIVNDENYCVNLDDAPVSRQENCDALELMRQFNVMMVSSAGNNRVKLQFPAGEKGTVAVGGLDSQGLYWNESPGIGGIFDIDSDDSNCPYSGAQNECGSNISNPPIDQKVDVVTQATAVRSTFYEGGIWNQDVGCTDEADGVIDGYGLCTGTSASSPQVAAIIQLMRSTNPLLPNGSYDPNLNTGLINILNSTSSRSVLKQGVNDYLGYGIPSASLALEKILGYSGEQLMKTRLTPMFEVVSTDANNHVYSPFPQLTTAFLIANGNDYESNPSAEPVIEFPSYWHGPNVNISEPRANFYVFTTNNNPFTGTKNMTPLRRMEKTVGNNRNDTYAINTAEIEAFHAEGFNYAGIEGYVLPACSPVSSCTPQGATRLYRDESDGMNHKLVTVSGNINPAPANSVFLGFVYLNVDADGDGLINGQEIILGTDIFKADSDGDDIPDGVEYPAAGVPYSDPLVSDIIYKHGFET